MLKLILILISLNLIFCSSPSIIDETPSYYKGGNGLSYAEAVRFPGIEISFAAIPLEEKWLKEKYPGYEKVEQNLTTKNAKSFDVIIIKNKNGKQKKIYFELP